MSVKESSALQQWARQRTLILWRSS